MGRYIADPVTGFNYYLREEILDHPGFYKADWYTTDREGYTITREVGLCDEYIASCRELTEDEIRSLDLIF